MQAVHICLRCRTRWKRYWKESINVSKIIYSIHKLSLDIYRQIVYSYTNDTTRKDTTTMASKTFYYARVSTQEQNLDRQLAAFRAMGADDRDIITDKASGKTFDRPGYNALKSAMLREGDTLVIKSLDRLGRNKQAIYEELSFFKNNGIRLKVMDIPTTMAEIPDGASQEWVLDMVNNILFEVYASIAQEELETRATRQAEGYAAMERREDGKRYSKRTGKAEGRPAWQKPAAWDETIAEVKAGRMTAAAAMRAMGVSKSSFYKQLALEDASRE